MRVWLVATAVAVSVVAPSMTAASAAAEPVSTDYSCRIGGKGGLVLAGGTTRAVVTVDLPAPSKVQVGDRVSFAGTMSVALEEKVRRPLRLTTNTLRLQADDVRMAAEALPRIPVKWASDEVATNAAPLTLTGPLVLPDAVAAKPGELTVAMPETLELQATGTGLLGPTRFALSCTAVEDAPGAIVSVAVAAKPVPEPPVAPVAPLSAVPSSVLPAPAVEQVPAQEIVRTVPTVAVSLSQSDAPSTTRRDITTAAAVLVALALAYAAWCELRLRGLRSRVRSDALR